MALYSSKAAFKQNIQFVQSADDTQDCSSDFHPPSCTVFLPPRWHSNTHCVLLPSPQPSDADYRLCGVLSVRGQDCSSRCVWCLCASVAIVCLHLRVCVCVCYSARVEACAGGVAYGCRVGWALLCTPGVKWTV